MNSFFTMTFQNQFRGDQARGFRPALGQIYGSYDNLPTSDWSPSQVQEAPKAPDPVKPSGTSDTDWAKILSEGIKGAATGYGAYTQAQIAKMKAEYDILRSRNPAIPPLQQDSKTTTIALVVGGIAVIGLIAVVALK